MMSYGGIKLKDDTVKYYHPTHGKYYTYEQDDTVHYFHPIHLDYYTYKELQLMWEEAYKLPNTPKTPPVQPKAKEEPTLREIPEKPVSKLIPNANYSPKDPPTTRIPNVTSDVDIQSQMPTIHDGPDTYATDNFTSTDLHIHKTHQ